MTNLVIDKQHEPNPTRTHTRIPPADPKDQAETATSAPVTPSTGVIAVAATVAVTVAPRDVAVTSPLPASVGDSTQAATAKKRKFSHTNEAQRRCMLEWLELDSNFQLLTAPAGSSAHRAGQTGKKVKKTDGFRALMRHVNAHAHADWTMAVTKSRFESFVMTYKKAKTMASQPGFDVSPSDRARGVVDVAQKLNSMCLFYDRMDALFESKPRPASMKANCDNFNSDEASLTVPLAAATTDVVRFEDPSQVSTLQPDQGFRHATLGTSHDASRVQEWKFSDAQVTDVDISRQRKRVQQFEHASKAAGDVAEDTTEAPPIPELMTPQQLALERHKLTLMQEKLEIQRRDLDLREQEFRTREEEHQQRMRADIVGKLVLAGKDVCEIKEYLELIERT